METVDDEILANAVKFLDKARQDNKPFFLWLNPTRMHVVTHLSEKYEKLRTPENGWSISEAGMAQLDDIVGSVMKYLRDNNLENIVSGLDWFPTFVAAAGNPNIVEELKKGKQIGDATYKVHLDGYDQTALITGKGPSKRHEIFYFAETTLGAVRIDDFKYRFLDQPNGWFGGTVKPDWPILVNLRLDPF